MHCILNHVGVESDPASALSLTSKHPAMAFACRHIDFQLLTTYL